MTDLVGLLYRADWTRLSLAAEVSVRRDLDLDRAQTEAAVAPPGHEWEMATDQLGTKTRRSTLLIEPGRRYREQGEDHAGGCDGDRSWLAIREGDGWNVEADDGPEPPLPPMLRPSWLLTGYTLEVSEPVTVGEREALRLVATPRPGIRSRASAGTRPLDRVEMLVDAGLGILLRHEEILDGRTLSVTELTEVRLDPAPVDDDQFVPPGGWDSVPGSVPRAAPWGPGREAAKLIAGLAAGGSGAGQVLAVPVVRAGHAGGTRGGDAAGSGTPALGRARRYRPAAAPAVRQPGPLGNGDHGHAAPVARHGRDAGPDPGRRAASWGSAGSATSSTRRASG